MIRISFLTTDNTDGTDRKTEFDAPLILSVLSVLSVVKTYLCFIPVHAWSFAPRKTRWSRRRAVAAWRHRGSSADNCFADRTQDAGRAGNRRRREAPAN